MKWTNYTSRQESVANLLLWVVMFALPLLGLVFLASVEDKYEFHWVDVLYVWRPMVLIVVAFLVHNFFIAPILIYKHNTMRYLSLVLVLLLAFVAYQCSAPRHIKSNMPPPPHEYHQPGPVHAPDLEATPAQTTERAKTPPAPIAGPQDFTMFSLLLFALGANLGIKLYFKTSADRELLDELERENLKQELIYLRYQVNPHFLMNTLNNIHALVDIDPNKAKASIVQLSKFLRHILYDCNNDTISLQQAVRLIEDYIALMRMRYTDRVDIRLETPDKMPDVQVAPLIFLPFIENAFKHGVSYGKPSFIHVNIAMRQDNVLFACRNSKNLKAHEHGGMGLVNVHKRLDLIYGDRYNLDINETGEVYALDLTLPAIHSDDTPTDLK